MRAPVGDLLLDGEPTGLVVVACGGFVARAVGCWRWGGRVPRGVVLWLAPCRAIQTFGLPRPIEVAFCDDAGTILRLVAPVAPHRLAGCRAATGAFELRTGTALRLGLCRGRRLQVAVRGGDAATAGRRCPGGGDPTHGRPPGRAGQRGVAMVEFALVAILGLLPLVLGILQVSALLVAHDLLSLATFQATRAGTLAGADPATMQAALARGLLPLYVPVARGGQVPAAQALAGYGRALLEVRTLDSLDVLEPTRAAVRGLLEARGTRQVLPNSAIEWRSPEAQAASVLTVAVVHCQPLVVPLVGPALAELLAVTSGPGTGTGTGTGAGAGAGAEARCRAAGRVPLRSRASLVMQSDLPVGNLPP